MSDEQTSSPSLERLRARLNVLREGLRELEQGLQDLEFTPGAFTSRVDAASFSPTEIARAADRLGRGETQKDILEALLDELRVAAERAVLFLRADSGYIAHRGVGFEAPVWEGLVVDQEGPVSEAVQSREVVQIPPASGRPQWIDRLAPRGPAALIPMFFQERAPLLVYVDSSGPLDLGAAQVLVQLAKLLVQNRYLHYLLDLERGELPEAGRWSVPESPPISAAALSRETLPEPPTEVVEKPAAEGPLEAEQASADTDFETETEALTPEPETASAAPGPATEAAETPTGTDRGLDMPPPEAPPLDETFPEERIPDFAAEDEPAGSERESETVTAIESGLDATRDFEPFPPSPEPVEPGDAEPPAEATPPVGETDARAGQVEGVYELEPMSKLAAEELGLSDEEFEKLMGQASLDWKEAGVPAGEAPPAPAASVEDLDEEQPPVEEIPFPKADVAAGEDVWRETAQSDVAEPVVGEEAAAAEMEPAPDMGTQPWAAEKEETQAAEEKAEEEETVPTEPRPVVETPPRPVEGGEPAVETGTAPSVEPPPLSPEEEAIHADARRFARLLVAEIKLYNEAEVEAGRKQGDLYRRLQADIDRSREMYEKRAHPSVRERADYFHSEMVRVLAQDNPALLGVEYAGPGTEGLSDGA